MNPWVLPALLGVFLVAAIAAPLLRLYLRTGTFGLVVHRSRGPAERFTAAWFSASLIGLGVFAFALPGLGPAALGVARTPAPVQLVGAVTAFAGLALIVAAQANMGPSWRIGIDPEPTGLVTTGLYAWSRNPIYLGVQVMVLGVLGMAPSPWTAALAAVTGLSLGVQARLEEAHQERQHGPTWRRYASRVGRFVPGLGLIREEAPAE